jgi:hypothetical protein
VYDSSALNPKAAEMVYTIIHRSGKQWEYTKEPKVQKMMVK